MGRRSAWKLPYVDSKLLEKVRKMKESGKIRPIKTWSRRSTIVDLFMDMVFEVHNGKSFIPVTVSDRNMMGHKLGEFSPTRKRPKHPEKKNVQTAAKKKGGK